MDLVFDDYKIAFDSWSRQVRSKYNITGDLSYFDCLRFEISKFESFVIGIVQEEEMINESENVFFILFENEESTFLLEDSNIIDDLNKWLEILNENEVSKVLDNQFFFKNKKELK